MESGFIFDSLTEAKKRLLLGANELYPKETDKFLKDEAKKLRKETKKTAKKEVGTSKGSKKNWDKKKSYHQRFKIGKIYTYSENDKCIRVFNSARHAHLVEYGHANVPRGEKRATTRQGRKEQLKTRSVTGYTLGRYVMYLTETEFATQFMLDADDFLYQFVDDTIFGKL